MTMNKRALAWDSTGQRRRTISSLLSNKQSAAGVPHRLVYCNRLAAIATELGPRPMMSSPAPGTPDLQPKAHH